MTWRGGVWCCEASFVICPARSTSCSLCCDVVLVQIISNIQVNFSRRRRAQGGAISVLRRRAAALSAPVRVSDRGVGGPRGSYGRNPTQSSLPGRPTRDAGPGGPSRAPSASFHVRAFSAAGFGRVGRRTLVPLRYAPLHIAWHIPKLRTPRPLPHLYSGLRRERIILVTVRAQERMRHRQALSGGRP